MNVTIKDIARVANVSYSTVSKALNDSPLVKENTKKKILQIARELGYHPNIAAKSLVSKKSDTIGVVWPTIERAFWSNLITLINEKLKKRAYHMLLSINPVDAAIDLFQQFRVDGILVFGNNEKLDETSTSIPLLYYGNENTLRYPSINVNRRGAMFKAVQYLYELGHRNIAYIGDLSYMEKDQQEKYIGFTEGLIQCGLPSHPEMTVNTEGYEWRNGYDAANRLLQSAYEPTAVVCGSYEITIGVLRSLKEARVAIPDRMSVISYDNIPQMESLDVPVTSVGVPIEQIADRIVDSLLTLIEKPGYALPIEHPDDVELVPRASTAPPKTKNPSI